MAATFQVLSQIFSSIRFMVGKDANTLTDANLTALANKHYLWILRNLNEGEFVSGEISTADLVANQQEYPLPVDDTASTYGGGAIQLLRVETALDGTNWKLAKKLDMLSYGLPANGSAPYNMYTVSEPAYALYDNSIWFYPTPTTAVTGGFKIYWIKRPDELTTASIPDMSKDFFGVLELFVRADVLAMLGKSSESIAIKQEAYQLLEKAKQMVKSTPEDFVLTPKKTVSNYR